MDVWLYDGSTCFNQQKQSTTNLTCIDLCLIYSIFKTQAFFLDEKSGPDIPGFVTRCTYLFFIQWDRFTVLFHTGSRPWSCPKIEFP